MVPLQRRVNISNIIILHQREKHTDILCGATSEKGKYNSNIIILHQREKHTDILCGATSEKGKYNSNIIILHQREKHTDILCGATSEKGKYNSNIILHQTTHDYKVNYYLQIMTNQSIRFISNSFHFYDTELQNVFSSYTVLRLT